MPVTVGSARICRRVECLLGNLVTDAMLWKINQNLPPADRYQIAFQNGGGLRAPIDVGPVTYGEVLEVLRSGTPSPRSRSQVQCCCRRWRTACATIRRMAASRR
jgi:hypothetical protein